MDDAAAFARLIRALRPWLGHLVIVGGWAHRLHRLHPLARKPHYAPIRTRDVDLAMSLRAPIEGDIRAALEREGFTREFVGTDTPPVTYYALGDEDAAFYAEFLVPLVGSELKRDGTPEVAVSKAGVTVQKLRHLEVLLVSPWSARLDAQTEVPFDEPIEVLLANPVSFIVQKLLIHQVRTPDKRAQDVLYIHDTLELFGAALDELQVVWREQVRPEIPEKTAKRAQRLASELFAQVTDAIRQAARIAQDRLLAPEVVRGACEYGLEQVFPPS